MSETSPHFGAPRSRVDGRAKVTGTAKYAGEYTAAGLVHGYVVSGAVARGRITRIDTAAARAVPGVLEVFTHENRPSTAWLSRKYQDEVAPPGTPFRPLYDAEVVYSGQPVALVVADSFETARYAAALVDVEYDVQPHRTDLAVARADAYVPPKKRSGITPPPEPRGNADEMLESAAAQVRGEYHIASEHHNPMEPHATTVVWEGDGRITVYDKIQGVGNTKGYITGVFGLADKDVRVLAPYVGGGFGSGLRPQYQLFFAVMAALALKRSVRVVLTRDQMFSFGFRPETYHTLALGATPDGALQAIRHSAVAVTSRFEDYQEVVVNWSGLVYHCDNVKLDYELAQVDTYTPADMRAPGAPQGMFALESGMDELAYALKMDPVELRLKNDSTSDQNTDKKYTSKELRAAYRMGAERFGWSRRTPAPRSMREGRELIGWGMAAGVWEAMMQKTSARATLTADGRLEVATATADIGTGTYTILAQIAADALGLGMDDVSVRIADTELPHAPIEGGSWTAASAGSAVQLACHAVREALFKHARGVEGSPLANADREHVAFMGGRMTLLSDPSRSMGIAEAMQRAGVEKIELEETASPSTVTQKRYSAYTHSAVFVEVRVDEELGVIRVTRVVDAVAAGKIINPKTARSQVIGGVVFGISMALHEESMLDNTLGRFMNHNLAEYHVPVNADIHDIEVVFVDEHDDKVSPIGVKGLGEIGIVGTAAAVANAVFHATGKRLRDLPITIDKVLAAEA